ncbi:SprT family zinc-dependent metalloprotease [Acinetobacter bereziniae]|uniref:M48 family metallopeptidase n=1 Tax=Acinetobacter bereziniae TaxID=106648 RepID=UPI00125EB210|nr:SprT family zinc-dependent metalloprotease [Acinetobacter bereziniae]MDQ9817786.1 SprT family zinc-dependent metalloprotease [Acinetobacter bereziniae]
MSETLKIGSIDIEVHRKDVKNLNITVHPPLGDVRVSVPLSMSETSVRMAIIGRLAWIKKQQADFKEQRRQSKREMISGESHYLWGKHYRLNVIERNGKHVIKKHGKWLDLYVSPNATEDNRRKVIEAFYRIELKTALDDLLVEWQKRLHVKLNAYGIRKMKTKWGSCNTDAARTLFNLELAKKPYECLEYIVVHELVHLLVRTHNDEFKALMDVHVPDWKLRKALLKDQLLTDL